jgi:peptidyl-dipeptidase A
LEQVTLVEKVMGSNQAQKAPLAEMALRGLLNKLERLLEVIDAAYADAQWREHFGRVGDNGLERLEAARSALLSDDQMRAILNRWEGRLRDVSLSRRMTLLSRRFLWAGIESRPEVYKLRNRIDQAILAFQPQIDGAPVSRAGRADILRRHSDRARRREAWLAMGPLAARIEADVRELMHRREERARELGHDGFVDLALAVAGLSRQQVEGWFAELRRQTDAPYRAWLAEAAQCLSLKSLRPWDLAFAAEREAPLPEAAFPGDGSLRAVRAVADGLGLGEAAAGVRVDVVDTPYAGLCYAVRPPDDVRVLLNPRDGHAAYDVLFHEFGHALYHRCVQSNSPALHWESPTFNEAMACIWQRLVSEPEWLMGYNGITPDQAVASRRTWTRRMVYRLRTLMAQATFEYRAYQDVDGDLLALSRDVYADYLGVPCDGAPGWADSAFWTSHPIYVQNYVIAEMVASQTLATLRRWFGRLVNEPRVGAWLVENYYAPGASLPWAEKVLRATGGPLSSADLVVDLGCDG